MSVSVISRNDLSGLIPEPVTREIIQGVTEGSSVLRMGRRLPNMTANTQTMNVLDALPTAYFVNGDTGAKQTTKMAWDKKKIYAEEIAVIVPIPESVLADSAYDIWGEVRPRLVEAFGKVIDGAILFGKNKPATWRKGIVQTAVDSGNVVYPSGGSTIFNDIMGENGLIAKVEEDGYMPDGVMAGIGMRAKLRGVVDQNGQPIFKSDFQSGTSYALDGMRMDFPMNGAFDTSLANMIVGDWTQLVYAIRQDITFKIFTEGVVQDTDGSIVYNLMQNDMVALRAVMRLGWEIPNPINAFNASNSTRCPFSVYSPDAKITLGDSTKSMVKTAGTTATTTVSNANGDCTVTITDSDGAPYTKLTGAVANNTLTITAGTGAAAGTYKVTVTDEAFDSASLTLTVTNAG